MGAQASGVNSHRRRQLMMRMTGLPLLLLLLLWLDFSCH